MAMARRVVVFPVRGSRWAFGVTPLPPSEASKADVTLLQIWHNACDEAVQNAMQGKGIIRSALNTQWNLSVVTQHIVDKTLRFAERKWNSLAEAPKGSMRNKMHSMGEKLLSQINPAETFLRSIPRDFSTLQITFPASLNSRLVRRKVRRIAMSGVQVHRGYLYGSLALLPFSVLFSIVPVPNAPLFWNLYRAYANWQALQGSRKLVQFVSEDEDSVKPESASMSDIKKYTLVLSPCETLESMMQDKTQALTDTSVEAISRHYQLDYPQMLKWRDYVNKKKVF